MRLFYSRYFVLALALLVTIPWGLEKVLGSFEREAGSAAPPFARTSPATADLILDLELLQFDTANRKVPEDVAAHLPPGTSCSWGTFRLSLPPSR